MPDCPNCNHEDALKWFRRLPDEEIDRLAEMYVALRKRSEPSVQRKRFSCYLARKLLSGEVLNVEAD